VQKAQGKRRALPETPSFDFFTEVGVVFWAGYRADSLPSLLLGLEQVRESSVNYHVHQALFRCTKYPWAEYTNDFAVWVNTVLGQKGLAEKLSSVAPFDHATVSQTRGQLAAHIRSYIAEAEVFYRVPQGREFYFMEARSFVLQTGIQAARVVDLADCLERMSSGTIFHHFIQARLRNEAGTNDFSRWLRLRGEEEKAEALDRLSPYCYSIEVLKNQIREILRC
jgi:hypothetical protein